MQNERNTSPYDEILELLARYYDGLYTLDAAKLRGVFAPSATYATVRDGDVVALGIDEYLPRLAERTPPSAEGTPYAYRVDTLHLAGETTALAELRCSLFGHDYTDLLSLLKVDGRWWIQSKVFEGVPSLAGDSAPVQTTLAEGGR